MSGIESQVLLVTLGAAVSLSDRMDRVGHYKYNETLVLQSEDFFFLTALFYISEQAYVAIRITSLLSITFLTMQTMADYIIFHTKHMMVSGCYKVFIMSLGCGSN